ncbi:MAG: TonB-dependent receptor [Taibaiella sp.]|nr:TonB-dependent receptor [Taibaiella sp.]
MALHMIRPALIAMITLFPILVQAQGILKGKITNGSGAGIADASISFPGSEQEYTTDSLGNFELQLPANQKIKLTITALGYEPEYKNVTINNTGKEHQIRIQMQELTMMLEGIEVRGTRRNEIGQISFDPNDAGIRPDPTGGVEGMLKVLVGSKNEMSSQYSVRGGNFDENLVYINDFEVYRPFLVRSGQQEGLSVINPDLTARVDFSVGGFQARMGDKMSSALDITYKRPRDFGGSFMVSLLGLQGHLETSSRDSNFYFMVGIRSKTNQVLLQAQPTKGQYIPSFLDAQIATGYRVNAHWSIDAIANYSRNRFTFYPESSSEFFGFLNQAYVLNSVYEGAEIDQFDAMFGGISLSYIPNNRTILKFLVSTFSTNEKETYDLSQTYLLSAVETDLGKNVGEILYSLGSGTVMNHARNYLQANVVNYGHKGSYSSGAHFWQWGLNYQTVRVLDQLKEWEYRDSAGYSQPNNPSVAAMFYSYDTDNEINYQRFSAYIQDNILFGGSSVSTLNIGLRMNYSFLNKETILSPRVQYSLAPDWGGAHNVIFRLATGMYAQPPFYREMRSFTGPLNTQLKAQKSWQGSAGLDWNFTAWNERPFKLTAELFYKYLWDLTPYEYDNVRIRYYPDRTAIGYAYGGEVRLFGDLVRNAESWISIGYLKTENKFLRTDGTYTDYIPRPTDQRVNFGMYFSDYLPRNKNFKVFLNMLYSTGLPFSMPGKAFEPGYQIRIPDYKRVDIGFATLLLDGKRSYRPAYSLFSYFDDIWLSLEVFNLLGNLNTVSYDWIQPLDTEASFLVPNRLTSRLINVKLAIRF